MTLPFLLSITHGGDQVPEEAAPLTVLTESDIFSDGDACAREIYGLGDKAFSVHQAKVARAFVDLNRGTNAGPPEHPDGVVKSLTANRVAVWQDGDSPSDAFSETQIDRYWRPYHDCFEELASLPDVRLGIDCHSMAELAPTIAARPGEARPLFGLSNGDGETAPIELLTQLADTLAELFGCEPEAIKINVPF